MLPLKSAIQSATFCTVVRLSSASTLTLRDAVWRRRSAETRSRRPMRAQQVDGGGGVAAQELIEVAAVEAERVERLRDHDRRGARPAVEQRELAHDVARARDLQDDARSRCRP